MRAFKRFGIAQLICSCAFVPQASAVQVQLSDYALVSWREIGSLNAPVIYAITQDHDGYLWLGTNGGLIRFDGATFVRWDVGRRSQRIPIGALAVAKDGSLWIGFRGGGGVSHIHGGEITSFTASQGVAPGNVRVVFEDDEGTIWVGAVGGLSRFQNSRWEHLSLRPQDAEAGVTGIYEDRHSQLWIATPVGIFVRPTGSDAFQQYASALVARAFVEDQEGVVWAATREKGLVPLLEGDHAGTFSIPEVNEGFRLLTSRSGDLWVATLGAGVFRLSVGTPSGFRIIKHFTEADGLPGTVARALYEDGEGILWIGTERGLSRLTESPFLQDRFPVAEIASRRVRAVTVTPDGSLWVGTARGLYQFQGTDRAAYIEHPGLQGVGVWALHADRHGVLWVALEGGKVARLENGQFVFAPVPGDIAGLRSITTDAHEQLWLMDRMRGVLRWADNRLSHVSRRSDASVGMPVSALTDSAGTVWVGFGNGDILRFDERRKEQYSQELGTNGGTVAALYEDSEGTIWAGTSAGLSRFSEGRFSTFGRIGGLSLNDVSAIIEDDRGYLWIGFAAGVVRLSPSNFSEAGQVAESEIRYHFLDATDGLPAVPLWQNGYPTVARDHLGILYFVTSHGLAILDPRRVRERSRFPMARIEGVSVDGRPTEPGTPVNLPHQASRVTISYSAATLIGSSKTRFRYRLEGWDQEWVNADARREAHYTNLPAGSYYFRVAANLGGPWRESAVPLLITVPPKFYETGWFLVLIVMSFSILAALVWQTRVRQQRARFVAAMAERARVGRELHDTLLQDLASIPLHLENAAEEVGHSPHNIVRGQLRALRQQVEASVREARRAVWALRPADLKQKDVAQSLREFGTQAVRDEPVHFELGVRGAPYRLASSVQEQIVRIAQEAITNAVHHAHAETIRVELEYETRSLTLRVRDDGHSIHEASDPDNLGRQSDHWGLRGMRERAQLIGARYSLTSRPGHGVVVEVVVPVRSTTQEPA